jgi:U3 small nucleolar ribonucleoprotein component
MANLISVEETKALADEIPGTRNEENVDNLEALYRLIKIEEAVGDDSPYKEAVETEVLYTRTALALLGAKKNKSLREKFGNDYQGARKLAAVLRKKVIAQEAETELESGGVNDAARTIAARKTGILMNKDGSAAGWTGTIKADIAKQLVELNK